MLWYMENRSTTLPYVFIALLGKKKFILDERHMNNSILNGVHYHYL